MICQAIGHCFCGAHEEITFHIPLEFSIGLACGIVSHVYLSEILFHLLDLQGLDLDICGLTPGTA